VPVCPILESPEIESTQIVFPCLQVCKPSDVIRDFGGLDVSLSSTAFMSLRDAAVQIVDYPFECAEQLASRLIVMVTMRDMLRAFAPEQVWH
jgi:alpha-2-macroglobulin